MDRTEKKIGFLGSPWTIGIGTTIISVFLLRIIDWLTGTSMVNSLVGWLIKLAINIWSFLATDYQLPFYSLILIFLSGPILLFVTLLALSKKEVKKVEEQEPQPEWLNYLKDNFNGVQYRWRYDKNSEGLFEVQSIRPFCSKCDCLIIDQRCPNCNASYWNKIRGADETKALIYHRLENTYGVKVH